MKKRFYLYTSWQESILLLSTEEQAQMLQNFFNYAKGEEPVLNTSGLKLVWTGIKFLLEKDHQSYCEAVERAHGTKKNKPVPQKKSMVPQKNIMVPYDNDNANANANANENANANANANKNVDEKEGSNVATMMDKFNTLFNQ